MKFKYIIFCFFIIFVLACNKKVVSHKENVKPLSDEQKIEYNYAFTEATKQQLFGNLKNAALLYNKCLELNPRSSAIYYQLSSIYALTSNLDLAAVMANKAVNLDKSNIWYQIQLAKVYQLSNKNDSVIKVYESIVKNFPDNNERKLDLAMMYAETGNLNGSLKLIQQLEAATGSKMHQAKKEIYIRQKKYDKALLEIEQLNIEEPQNIDNLGQLAELYSGMGNFTMAQNIYNQIFAIDSTRKDVRLSYAEFLFHKGLKTQSLLYIRSVLEREPMINGDEAINIIMPFISNDSIPQIEENVLDSIFQILIESDSMQLKYYALRADMKVRTGKFEEAALDLHFIISKDPSKYIFWEQLIYIYNYLGDWTKVSKVCSDAISIFPEKPVPYILNGISLIQRKEYDKAITYLEKALQISDTDELKLQTLMFLAEAHHDLNHYDKSDSYFNQGLKIDSNNIMILNNYSYYLSLRDKELDKALEMSAKTIKKEPLNPTYLDTYAWILFKLKRYKEANQFISMAYSNGAGMDPDVISHYVDILLGLNMNEKALEILQKGINDTQDDALIKKLSTLKE